ncbi:hypothetical protein Vadar_023284 [Vaccinium darrowii]|uniref:Uncharacterized protein n=1 Tax=Vaccinium darrowii TaxID=229202 RepID=A0ACB7YPE0_9ERIC|nr:hypothetical protein Vadar_023284 [Vaccinium darrowii]
MDEYVDEIRGYAQKLEAIGYHIDDDDLVFYALKGLPSEFKPVRSALTAKGDVVFDELATILKNEESQLERDEGLGSAKVFLAQSASIAHEATTYGTQMVSNPQVSQSGLLGPVPQYYHVPMHQNSHDSSPYFPVQTSGNVNFGGAQRQKGGKGVPQTGNSYSGGFQALVATTPASVAPTPQIAGPVSDLHSPCHTSVAVPNTLPTAEPNLFQSTSTLVSPQISNITSSLPHINPNISHHPMQTRSKSGGKGGYVPPQQS